MKDIESEFASFPATAEWFRLRGIARDGGFAVDGWRGTKGTSLAQGYRWRVYCEANASLTKYSIAVVVCA
jgi:hypothetical protein